VHWVAHSYGGIVALHCLALGRPLPPGRIVLIGSPVQAAPRRAAWPGGPSPGPGSATPWSTACSAGRRADRRSRGGGHCRRPVARIGGLLAGFDEPHDGTVAVAETVLPGATDRIVLRHSHFGLVFSAEVADAVASFLLTGRLSLEPAA